MFKTRHNNRGMTLVEVLIAHFLITGAVLALISIQPQAWRVSANSDLLGRAAGILHAELEANEAFLINPCNSNPCAGVNPSISTRNVFISGKSAAQAGDSNFTVQTTITDSLNNTWTVLVRITWPGNNTGISESLVVTRQEPFRFPSGCV